MGLIREMLRIFRRNPATTITMIVIMGLGIGANTAIFSVVEAVLLHPLPYPNPEHLAQAIYDSQSSGPPQEWVFYSDVRDWREHNHTFIDLGLYHFALLDLLQGNEPVALYGVRVSDGALPAVGVMPRLGRLFIPEEYKPGNDHVILLSDDLWHRLGDDPEIVGKPLHFDGQTFTVVGVMPADFNFPLKLVATTRLPTHQMQFWVPLGLKNENERRVGWTVGRLKPGVTAKDAESDLSVVSAQLARQRGEDPSDTGVKVSGLKDKIMGSSRPMLIALFGGAGLVLLLACTNAANLQLARLVQQQHELAVRLALGATRMKLFRQGLSEGIVLAGVAGMIGVISAYLTLPVLLRMAPQGIPRLMDSKINGPILLFSLGLTLLSAVLFAAVATWQTARTDPQYALKDVGTGVSTGRRTRSVREILIVVEFAMATLLAIGAGLLTRSFLKVMHNDPGYLTHGVTVAEIVLPNSLYPEKAQKLNFYQQLLTRVQQLPNVKSAAITLALPLSGSDAVGQITREGVVQKPGEQAPKGEIHAVSPEYFTTMGISLQRGRSFTSTDTADKPLVAIISETAALQLYPGQDPIGKRLSIAKKDNNPVWVEVVGIAADTRHNGLEVEPPPEIYMPLAQSQFPPAAIAVQSDVPLQTLTTELRREVAAMDANQAIWITMSMEQLLNDSLAERQFTMLLVTIFGGLALLIATAGVYGVIAFLVSQRSKEIAIRIALGANRSRIFGMVVRHSMLVGGCGVLLGIISAFLASRLLTRLVYRVSVTDPETFFTVCIALLIIGGLAALRPAMRASSTPPAIVLRES